MAIKVEERNGWLCYRVYFDGWQGRESTGCRDTARNREKLERKARTMSDLMEEGAFDYLKWFPNGNRASLYRPAPPPEPTRAPTVREYAEGTWLPRMTPPAVRASLEKSYRKHLKGHILSAFGAKRLDEVTGGALVDFRALLTRSKREDGRGLKMKTARDIIDGTFRALYRDARTIDLLVTDDPFATLRWPRKITPEPDPFNDEERDALLAHFRQKDRFWFPYVFTQFWTGMRPGEVNGLRRRAVDLRNGKLSVLVSRSYGEDNAPKTVRSERTVTLLPDVVAVLREMPRPVTVRPDDFVFTTPQGHPVDADRFVEQHWHRAFSATGIRPRKFYATRHTFISSALTNGLNLKWLADYCGTSVEMIEKHYGRYMHADASQLALLGRRNNASGRRAGAA